jgi:hypothetical protein
MYEGLKKFSTGCKSNHHKPSACIENNGRRTGNQSHINVKKGAYRKMKKGESKADDSDTERNRTALDYFNSTKQKMKLKSIQILGPATVYVGGV